LKKWVFRVGGESEVELGVREGLSPSYWGVDTSLENVRNRSFVRMRFLGAYFCACVNVWGSKYTIGPIMVVNFKIANDHVQA